MEARRTQDLFRPLESEGAFWKGEVTRTRHAPSGQEFPHFMRVKRGQ